MHRILAALVTVALCLVLVLGAFFVEHAVGPAQPEIFPIQWAMIAAAITVLPLTLMGALVFTLLQRRNHVRCGHFALGGLVAGALACGLLSLEQGDWLGVGLAFILLVTGLSGGVFYWVLGAPKAGPNNSSKPMPLRGTA